MLIFEANEMPTLDELRLLTDSALEESHYSNVPGEALVNLRRALDAETMLDLLELIEKNTRRIMDLEVGIASIRLLRANTGDVTVYQKKVHEACDSALKGKQ